MLTGCYTALVTPFKEDGSVDSEGLRELVEFQCIQGVSGLLAVGTTGESATLSWDEHLRVIQLVREYAQSRCTVIAGTGSNSTEECLAATRRAADVGVESVLLVDPYYNGPSSLEIRREYYEPVASAFPELGIVPYLIPGRTGTMLSPEDLSFLVRRHGNIVGVKDAIGDLQMTRRIRGLCPEGFPIICGDDESMLSMMTDPGIRASTSMSVIANILPSSIQSMADQFSQGRTEPASGLFEKLLPLLRSVTVTTSENTPFGPLRNKARNPLPIKTLMAILGMPCGPCRRPLGKVTVLALERLLESLRTVYDSTDTLRPIEDFFDVDLGDRLSDRCVLEGLAYDHD